MRSSARTRVQSGPVELDPATRQVRLDRSPVAISGLPYRILEQLMLADGRIVTRAELKQALWPYAERIDTERRLNTAVRALREALGDSGAKPRMIATVRGCGYRWIGSAELRPRRRGIGLHALAACAATLVVTASASLPHNEPSPTNVEQPARSAMADTHWRSSGLLYRAALRRDPTDFTAHRGLAWIYVNEGRGGAALPHIAPLLAVGSPQPATAAEVGWLLLRGGMPAAALAACSRPVAPTLNLLSCRQTALGRLGLVTEARATGLDVMRLARADDAAIRAVADAPAAIGYRRFLKWRVGAFVRPGRDWFQRAQLQAEAGLYADALASLRRAAAVHDPLLVKIASSREFAPLRGSPDFRRIAAKALTEARLS